MQSPKSLVRQAPCCAAQHYRNSISPARGRKFLRFLSSKSPFMPKAPEIEAERIGLCRDCLYSRRIDSDRGSTFYQCTRSAQDPDFPKYPRLPVIECSGFEPKAGHSDRS
jgi:hypothetical protein